MDVVWAPWRMAYILGDDHIEGCIFCDKPREDRDTENYIVFRGKSCFVILNAFPYNNGHLMIVPYRHCSSLSELEECELSEMMTVSAACERSLKERMQPDGFNLGINLGKVAGAGIESHLHLHLVPRWSGDTNFMPVVGNTKVIPDSLEHTYASLRQAVEAQFKGT